MLFFLFLLKPLTNICLMFSGDGCAWYIYLLVISVVPSALETLVTLEITNMDFIFAPLLSNFPCRIPDAGSFMFLSFPLSAIHHNLMVW